MAQGICFSNEQHGGVRQVHDTVAARQGRTPLHSRRDERTIARGSACSLLSAGETNAGGEGSALASRELAEIGGIHVVYHHVGVSVIQSVDQFDARGPQVSTEGELLF